MGKRRPQLFLEMEDGSRIDVPLTHLASGRSRGFPNRGTGISLAREQRVVTARKAERASQRATSRLIREYVG